MLEQFVEAWKREIFNAIMLLFLGAGAFGIGIVLSTKCEGGLRAFGVVLLIAGIVLFVGGLFAVVRWYGG